MLTKGTHLLCALNEAQVYGKMNTGYSQNCTCCIRQKSNRNESTQAIFILAFPTFGLIDRAILIMCFSMVACLCMCCDTNRGKKGTHECIILFVQPRHHWPFVLLESFIQGCSIRQLRFPIHCINA